MTRIVFMPGFDGDAALRRDFVAELRRGNEVVAVSYPNRPLGTLDEYRVHGMGQVPVDWKPVLVAESFSGLVAARWAAIDSRVRALVLCAAFARNPMGYATGFGAAWPELVKLGPAVMDSAVQLSSDPARRRWSSDLARTVASLRADVVAERLRLIAAEDVGALLRAMAIPVVLVQFEDDLVIGHAAREHLRSVCVDPHVVRIAGPHFALETRPVECAQAIAHALAAVLPGKGAA
jgi:pimeloyl-[acyl-carrier protein] methyl ester esterase